MRRLTPALVAVLALALAPAASAHLVAKPKADTLKAQAASQAQNLAHARYVAKHGKGPHVRWHRVASKWLGRELAETKRKLNPPRPAWGPWAFPDSCLREISRRETAGTFSPTIWNYQGSGAYGIGQALPASKMAPFGADYMTNPWTQLRWMIQYSRDRYGSSCAALRFHDAHGYW